MLTFCSFRMRSTSLRVQFAASRGFADDATASKYSASSRIAADAEALVAMRELAEYFEAVASSANPRLAANWTRNEVLRILNEQKVSIDQYRVTPAMLARLIRLIESGAIGGKAAKEVFEEMSASGSDPEAIVERKGLS